MNPIFAHLPTSIFEIMSHQARELGAVNLGQGFPEIDGFLEVREAAARALIDQSNQYAPMRGLPKLREAVAAYYTRTQGLGFDASQVLITSGATEAIAASLMALITPGDEVIVFEPMYDAYVPLIERAGGVVRIVPLSPPDWRIDEAVLAKVFSDKTRVVLLTTPNNPTTTCVTRSELELIARYCERFDAYVVSDEVWEAVVFDGAPLLVHGQLTSFAPPQGRRTIADAQSGVDVKAQKKSPSLHLSVAHVNGLKDRSLKIGSAGKIFSLTGWKVGFVTGPAPLVEQVARAHQFITFSTPPALQYACAFGLELPSSRFELALSELKTSRDLIVEKLAASDIITLPAHGTYFVNIDLAATGIRTPGVELAMRLVKDHGVATIPLAAFCPTGRDLPLLRLCFAKSDATLDLGITRLITGLRS